MISGCRRGKSSAAAISGVSVLAKSKAMLSFSVTFLAQKTLQPKDH